MFWELFQQGQIHSANRQADEAASRARRAENQANFVVNDIQQMQARLDSMAITCQAMWELVSERTNLKDSDLLQRMQEIDLRDGAEDGKMTKKPQACSACDRPVNPTRKQCMYCGAAMPQASEPFNL